MLSHYDNKKETSDIGELSPYGLESHMGGRCNWVGNYPFKKQTLKLLSQDSFPSWHWTFSLNEVTTEG
jgi:hypothetical protein